MDGELFYKAYASAPTHIGGYWKDGSPVEFTQEQLDLINSQPEDKQEEYALKLKSQ